MNYKHKTGGMLPTIVIPTGDIEKDIDFIKLQYKDISGKYPEKGIY